MKKKTPFTNNQFDPPLTTNVLEKNLGILILKMGNHLTLICKLKV